MEKNSNVDTRKTIKYLVILISAFVLGLIIGGSQNTKNKAFKSKASEISNKARVASIKPNLIGKITDIVSVNDGKKSLVVQGISDKDYELNTNSKSTPNKKNYLIMITPSTKIFKLLPKIKEITSNELVQNMEVVIYASGDYVTALRIDIK